MKRFLPPMAWFLGLITCFSVNAGAQDAYLTGGVVGLHTLPKPESSIKTGGLRFTENKGQVTDMHGHVRYDILFTGESEGVKLFLTSQGIHYQFRRDFAKPAQPNNKHGILDRPETEEVDSTQFYRIDVRLKGANPNPKVIKAGAGVDEEHFFLPHCPNGITGVKNYNRITYKEVYPNIDWVVYVKDGVLEYDFVVRPGGNINDIRLQYKGAENLVLDKAGSLHIKTSMGNVTELKPFSFQQEGKEVESRFVLKGNTLGFEVPVYNRWEVLTIDPVVAWATYYGGSNYDWGRAVATDASGNVYMAGYTKSAAGIASGGHQSTIIGTDFNAFLVKFNAEGVRQWATYYGGLSTGTIGQSTTGNGVATDPAGNVYLAGTTFCNSGIASGGHQNTYGGGTTDAFLVKFNSQGIRLWATYYGGSNFDYGNAISCDNSGNIFLSGYTRSFNAISSGGHRNTGSGGDDFLVKFDAGGVRQWGTYYGGMSAEYSGAFVATDGGGSAYLSGSTSRSSSIAYLGHRNTYSGNPHDGYLVKFDAAGVRQWATYYGGPSGSLRKPIFVATDADNNVFIAGYTTSATDIASGGHQNTKGSGEDAFLAKFNASGVRQWGTYYGGSGNDYGYAVITDVVGNVFLAGNTNSSEGIANDGVQNTFGGGDRDAFLVKFNANGVRQWGSYYGGTGTDFGYYIETNAINDLIMAGYTNSTTGIASGGHQNTYGGGDYDGFLIKFSDIPQTDTDGDGISDANDCAPNDNTRYRTANLYVDKDNDGYDAGQERVCYGAAIPAGYKSTTLGADCDDENGDITNLTWYRDEDNDGYSNGTTMLNCTRPAGYKQADELLALSGDCNDSKPEINPAATETCDGVDNNCNGQIDEGVKQLWYKDTDNDGYSNGTTLTQCDKPAGYKPASALIALNGDCDDTNAALNPVTIWYKDQDNDGYSNGLTHTQCLRPAGYKLAGELTALMGDCNDADAAIYPHATEVCDGKDNDCNGATDDACVQLEKTWYRDKDGDGYGSGSRTIVAIARPSRYVANGDDCNDSNPHVYPGAPELPDGIDNNCNGEVDEGLSCRQIWYRDADGDGYGRNSITKWSCVQPIKFVALGGDCADNDPLRHPGAADGCDGRDNNCNGQVDENCMPITGAASPKLLTAEAAANDNILKAKVWPNPAVSTLWVSLSGLMPHTKLEVVLVASDGKVVVTSAMMPATTQQQLSLQVKALGSGYYLLYIKQAGNIKTYKVFIQR